MAWDLTGNGGTNPTTNFLGTTDAQPVVIKSNNQEVVRIAAAGGRGRVEIVGQDGLTVSGFQPFITLRDTNGGNARSFVQGVNGDLVFVTESFAGSGGAPMVVKTGSGNVGIGTGEPSAKLHVIGDVEVTGDIRLTNADCAEDFDIVAEAEPSEPGTVMVLGEAGMLRPAEHPYDKRVAGVVAGAGDLKPGIVLDKQPRANRRAIALLGKTYCKVDSQYGDIEVGDLLTTSPTPGHAMKASDPQRAFGPVIGKALRALQHGQGLIPILIALQ